MRCLYNIDATGRSPTVCMQRDKVCGTFESLVVWRHPMRHIVISGFNYEERQDSQAHSSLVLHEFGRDAQISSDPA